jgi:hypothetical protein
MLIIGCDYHPGFQQIAFVDTETRRIVADSLQVAPGIAQLRGARSSPVAALPSDCRLRLLKR